MKWVRPTIFVLIAVLLIGAAMAFRFHAQGKLNRQLLVDAKTALEGDAFSEAEQLARRVILAGESTGEARLIAGEAAMKLGSDERALAYLEPLLDGTGQQSLIALNATIDVIWDKGDATEAERLLRRVLAIDSADTVATARLAYLLTLTGRHWESLPLRLHLIRQDQFQVEDLLLFGNARALIETEELGRLRLGSPNDPLLMLGEASIASRKNDLATAQQLVHRILEARPDLPAAHGLLGTLLIERPGLTATEIQNWNKNLPAEADEQPEVWFVRGLWSTRVGESTPAIRCFWEAVRRSPNHQSANYQMSLALRKNGDDRATWFSERADALEELERMLGVLNANPDDLSTLQTTVELTQRMGRHWETWGWSRFALLIDPQQEWAKQARDRAAEHLKEQLPQVAPEFDPGKRFNFSSYSLPTWMTDQ